MLAIAEFDLKYELAKAVKGQFLAIAEILRLLLNQFPRNYFLTDQYVARDLELVPYSCHPKEQVEFSFPAEAVTYNQAEYEAVLKGLKLLREAGAEFVEIIGDSLLILNRLAGE